MSGERLRIEARGEAAHFTVRLQPRASKDEVTGVVEGALRVRVTAPPVDGRANRRLLELLAEQLGVPRGSVRLAGGEKSRRKTVSIEGLTPAQIHARFAEILYNQ